jgi:hypothetical protein
MSLQIALNQYAQRKAEVDQLRQEIDSILEVAEQNIKDRGNASKQNLKEKNLLIDSRTNTLKAEDVKNFYDAISADGVVDNAEALALISIQYAWREKGAQDDIRRKIIEEKIDRHTFNLEIEAEVNNYISRLIRVTKGLRPKAFAKVNRLRTLVASLELDDAIKIDVTEDITAKDHPIQQILTLLK